MPRVAAARSIGVSSTAAAARSWRSGANLVLWLLIVVGILLGAAAAAPERLVHRLPGAALWKERELRIGSAAAGVALLVGVAIATQQSWGMRRIFSRRVGAGPVREAGRARPE